MARAALASIRDASRKTADHLPPRAAGMPRSSSRRYDTDLGGYRTLISGNRLKGAPKHGTETIFDWSARHAQLDDYYNDFVIRPG